MHHFVAIGEFKLELQSGNAQFGSKSMIFFSRVTLQFDVWPWKTIGHLFYATSSFVHHFVAIGEFKLELQSGNAQSGSNSAIFRAVWPRNLTDDLEQGKSEGFESCHRPIVRKRPIWVKIGDVCTVWPWKTIGHPSFAVSSFVQHFIAIGEFKLELQSGNAQFGSKSTIFLSRVTLQFDVWPWKNKGHLFYATSSFVYHFVAISDFKLELQSGNAQFGSKSTIFFSRVTLKFDGWPWKTIGHLFYAASSCVHDFIAICEFKLEWESGNG